MGAPRVAGLVFKTLHAKRTSGVEFRRSCSREKREKATPRRTLYNLDKQ